MNNPSLIYLLLKDFPKLRDYIYKSKLDNFTKEVREDIEKLRNTLIITEKVNHDETR